MKNKSICSDCGHTFKVDISDDIFTPKICPNCKGIISKVTNSTTSNDKVAWIK